MTQSEVRNLLRTKTEALRQKHIAEVTGIPPTVLSQFMNNDTKELWPEHLEKLADYLKAV